MFIMIIMINLLITIISDTYDKVAALNEHSSKFERINLILDTEMLMNSSERPSFGKYLIYSYCGNEIQEEKQQVEGTRLRKFVEILNDR